MMGCSGIGVLGLWERCDTGTWLFSLLRRCLTA